MASFTVGYIQGACMHVVHLHEKDTHHPKKKRQFVSRWEKKGKKKKDFLQGSDLHTADLGEGVKKRKLWVVPTSANPNPYSSGSTSHLAESSSWSATGFLLLCQMG